MFTKVITTYYEGGIKVTNFKSIHPVLKTFKIFMSWHLELCIDFNIQLYVKDKLFGLMVNKSSVSTTGPLRGLLLCFVSLAKCRSIALLNILLGWNILDGLTTVCGKTIFEGAGFEQCCLLPFFSSGGLLTLILCPAAVSWWFLL